MIFIYFEISWQNKPEIIYRILNIHFNNIIKCVRLLRICRFDIQLTMD